MKKLIFLFSLTFFALTVFAQNSRKEEKEGRRNEKRQKAIAQSKQEEEGVLDYNNQNAFGVQLRTNGYGVFYELGRMKSPRFATTYSLELSEIKHAKEEKYPGSSFFGNSFVYGKVNNFYQAKLGYGQQYIFGQKGNKNGVAVIGLYQGGLAIGLVKPYYIAVQNANGERVEIKYEQDTTRFLDPSDIYGGVGFTKGWKEVKVNPGAYAKAALRFDFGRFNESIQALEIGISADFYAKKVAQMAHNKPRQIFYQGHIAFVFGQRR